VALAFFPYAIWGRVSGCPPPPSVSSAAATQAQALVLRQMTKHVRTMKAKASVVKVKRSMHVSMVAKGRLTKALILRGAKGVLAARDARGPHLATALATSPRAAANPAAATATRRFTIKTLGGEAFQVSLPAHGDLGDLEAAVAKQRKTGLCFSLLDDNGRLLNDISCALPAEIELQCLVENTCGLCEAAQDVLKRVFPRGMEDPVMLERLRLGRCRRLGCFPGSAWKDGGIDSAYSDSEIEDEMYDYRGAYQVYEFTLVDGDGTRHRLIGVINESDNGVNRGMWGSVYLRPGMKEVALIRSCDQSLSASIWKICDESWYKIPSAPLPKCEILLIGGDRNAKTALQTHLAHALGLSYYGVRYADERFLG